MKIFLTFFVLLFMSYSAQGQTWEEIQDQTVFYLKELAGIRGVLHMCKDPVNAIETSNLIDQTIDVIVKQNIISEVVAKELQRLNDEETKRTIQQIKEDEGDTFYLFNKKYCEEVKLLLKGYQGQRKELIDNESNTVLKTLDDFEVFGLPLYKKYKPEYVLEKDEKNYGNTIQFKTIIPNKYFDNQTIYIYKNNNENGCVRCFKNSIEDITGYYHLELEDHNIAELRKKFNINKKVFVEILSLLENKYGKSSLRIDLPSVAISTTRLNNIKDQKIYKDITSVIEFLDGFDITDIKDYIEISIMYELKEDIAAYEFLETNEMLELERILTVRLDLTFGAVGKYYLSDIKIFYTPFLNQFDFKISDTNL